MTDNTHEALKLAIITALKNHEKEMEGYGYFGSNRGVSKDDYEDVADEALSAANAVVAEPGPNLTPGSSFMVDMDSVCRHAEAFGNGSIATSLIRDPVISHSAAAIPAPMDGYQHDSYSPEHIAAVLGMDAQPISQDKAIWTLRQISHLDPTGGAGTAVFMAKVALESKQQGTQPVSGAVDERETEAWLIEWDDTHGHRKVVHRHNAIGDYQAMYEDAISSELVRRDAALSSNQVDVQWERNAIL